MSYTTISAVKLHLGITDNEHDALINALIAEAETTIDDYCRTRFAVTVDSTRLFDPTCDVDGRTLYLDRHLAAITSVVNGDGVTIAASEYVTKPANEAPYWAIVLKSNNSIVWTYTDAHEGAIAVTGKWGYSGTVPVAVARAANLLVEAAFNTQGKGGFSKMDVEDLSVTMAPVKTATANVLTALQPYRRL
jgi:hypothetical protein